MHPGEEDVVADVAELRNPASGFGQIANGDWDVDDGEPLPAEAYRGFCVEVEPAGPADALHGIEQCCGRVDAKAEEGIVDTPPERLQVGPPIGDAPAFDAHRWGRLSKIGSPRTRAFLSFSDSAIMEGMRFGGCCPSASMVRT